MENFIAALEADIAENPTTCGAIEDDVTCTTAPAWQSTATCCGWVDEACERHRTMLDDLFSETDLPCGTCGQRINLTWKPLTDS
jgi:transcription elongation factor Elf1